MKNIRKRPLAATAVLALGFALTACSSDSDTGSAATESSTSVHGHVHGLGIDPADNRLYVATHNGVYTPGKDGAAQRVGNSKDDFMGFTVATAKTFLASGHPAPGNGGPGNRG